jgi:thiol-disulfide isomerase/thioredoxin
VRDTIKRHHLRRFGFLEGDMRLILALTIAAATLVPGTAAADWSVPPAGYAYTASTPCLDDPGRAGKPQRPNQAAYRVCEDQMALFKQALFEAKASRKLLLVSFGATWCPWCASLQRRMPTADLLGRKGDAVDYGKAFHYVEIGLSTLHKGQKAKIPSGEAVLAMVLERAPGVKIRTIPFIAVIDPDVADRAFARNLDDTATRDGDFDVARVRAVLTEAHDFMRKAMPAQAEPGWLQRKWQRLWNG